MKAQRCPICNGNGLVANGFYNQTTGAWTTNSTAFEKCRSCDGKGFVLVPISPSDEERKQVEDRLQQEAIMSSDYMAWDVAWWRGIERTIWL